MENELIGFKKNIISWYPIKKDSKVLQIGKNEEIYKELLNKTNNIVQIETLNEIEPKSEFDYVVLIGNFEKLKTEEEIINLIDFSKECLNKKGKILLATKNKFGMKYWTGEKESDDSKIFETIVSKTRNILGLSKLKKILNELDLKYKFYYPLPDYQITNVIYTDDYLPSKDSMDARNLNFCKDDDVLVFSERDAYKQLISQDKEMIPFFANSFFVEISEKADFEDIRYVGFGITRKPEFRIKTVIREKVVEKTADGEKGKEHIDNISRNIKVLNDAKIECLDTFEPDMIISKYLSNAKSYDSVLIDIYNQKGLDTVIEKIKEFKSNIIDKLLIEPAKSEKTVFEKYNIEISDEMKKELNFTKNGVIDLIFQNCLVKDEKIYVYDQEWYEENVPVEFILYRAIFYFTELNKQENINEIYQKLGIEKYIEIFEKLETIIQKDIVDEKIWELHRMSTKSLGGTKNFIDCYEARLDAANTHIRNLEAGINNLTELIKTKDKQLEEYANELRGISKSVSWRITSPIRNITRVFRKKK